MIDLFTSEPMKYWAPAANFSKTEFKKRLQMIAGTGTAVYSLKTDGNWSRAIITPSRSVLQTRGISKKTNTYGEVQNKVLWWQNVQNAFTDTTLILGEIYVDNGIDRDVGSILRCLDEKAIEKQKENPLKWRIFDVLYYEGKSLFDKTIIERIPYIDKVTQKINNSLVDAVKYYEMDNDFFIKLNSIFANGGEGVVIYDKKMKYIPGKRGPTAWETIKVKQSIQEDIDVFITRTEPATIDYTGKDLPTWKYWQNIKTGEKFNSDLFIRYTQGEPIKPITKGHYYDLPAAIYCAVYDDNGQIVEICKVAGLTDEMKYDLRDNFKENWYMTCLCIGGMLISNANTTPSIRHPYIKAIRSQDLNAKDCTLKKILTRNSGEI